MHAALVVLLLHPWTIPPAVLTWLGLHTASRRRAGRWTMLGADKSAAAGTVDVASAPPGELHHNKVRREQVDITLTLG